jgi:hypothetical protein
MTLTPIADDFPAIAAATNDAQMYADIRQMAEISIVPSWNSLTGRVPIGPRGISGARKFAKWPSSPAR